MKEIVLKEAGEVLESGRSEEYPSSELEKYRQFSAYQGAFIVLKH